MFTATRMFLFLEFSFLKLKPFFRSCH